MLKATFIKLTESRLINGVFEELIPLSYLKMTLFDLVGNLLVFILLFVNNFKAIVMMMRKRLSREF